MAYTYPDDVDEVAVVLACEGARPRLTPAERREAIRILNGLGWSDPKIAAHLGCAPEIVLRHRHRAGIAAVPHHRQHQHRGARA